MATATARPNNCWRSCGATGRGTTARRGRSSSSCSRRRGWKTPGSRPSGVGFRRFSFPDRRCGMARVSIFPLPGALLLPGMELPLRIFEPRYQAMIHDAMARDRRIGMIQPREEGVKPALFDMGCLGHITHIEALDGGRYNILLKGIARFRVVRELAVPTAFRQIEADVEPVAQEDEILSAVERAALEQESRRFADAMGYVVDWTAVSRLDARSEARGVGEEGVRTGR